MKHFNCKRSLAIWLGLLTLLMAQVAVAGSVAPLFEANEYLGNPNVECPRVGTSNPINLASRTRYYEEPIFREGGEFPIEVKLYYNSHRIQEDENGRYQYGLWTYSYGQRLIINNKLFPDRLPADVSAIEMIREDGRSVFFTGNGAQRSGIHVGNPINKDGYVTSKVGLGTLTYDANLGVYTYDSLNGTRERYDDNGRLVEVANLRGGGTHRITYKDIESDNSREVSVKHVETGRIVKMAMARLQVMQTTENQFIKFYYEYFPTLVTSPDGHEYGISVADRGLTGAGPTYWAKVRPDAIHWPGGSVTSYQYNYANSLTSTRYLSDTALTGVRVTDDLGVLTYAATYGYLDVEFPDEMGEDRLMHPFASVTTHGINDVTLSDEVLWGAPIAGSEEWLPGGHYRTVNDYRFPLVSLDQHPKGVYYFAAVGEKNNLVRLDSVRGMGAETGACFAGDANFTYDSAGNLDVVTSGELGADGVFAARATVDYDFSTDGEDINSFGLLQKVTTQDVLTTKKREVRYQWTNGVLPSRLPKQIDYPGRTVKFTYEYGRLKTRTETDISTLPVDYVSTHSVVRKWEYFYTYWGDDADGLHRVKTLKVTPPRGGATVYSQCH